MWKRYALMTLLFAGCDDVAEPSPVPPPILSPVPPGVPSDPPVEASNEAAAMEVGAPENAPTESGAWSPAPNTVRMIVLRPEGDPIPSEERDLNALETSLATTKGFEWAPATTPATVTRVDGTGAERVAAEAVLAGQLLERPASWNDSETIVIVRLAPPHVSRRSGRRTSQGRSGYAVLRAPSLSPRFLELDAGEQQ